MKCKYCHTDHELDGKGRCPSCADAANATRAGLSYGAYMARKYAGHLPPIPIPRPRPEPVSRANAVKVCRICGARIPPESPRRTLCSPECQAEYNRRSANAAHAKAKAQREANPKPPRCCALCGKPITRPNAKVCPACKDEYRRTYDREYRRKKQKGNAT